MNRRSLLQLAIASPLCLAAKSIPEVIQEPEEERDWTQGEDETDEEYKVRFSREWEEGKEKAKDLWATMLAIINPDIPAEHYKQLSETVKPDYAFDFNDVNKYSLYLEVKTPELFLLHTDLFSQALHQVSPGCGLHLTSDRDTPPDRWRIYHTDYLHLPPKQRLK